ncbi:IS4 family transposase [Metabacillus sp. Hm71]|uniref:IS4 family transposase n=1 Tax=Metabacillus sp. Hm71 TaxID=3450743 RepID=UPI003F41B8DD
MHQISSLTDISFQLNNNRALQEELGLKSISKSQLSRKLRDSPPEILQAVLNHLIQKVCQVIGLKETNRILGKLHLIDSSTITLCLSQHPWASKNRFTAGIKMHTRVVHHGGITYPDRLILTPARPADQTQLDHFIVNEHGALHIFGRGYFDFSKFEEFFVKGIRFVTRIKENTVIQVVEEVPVPSDSSIKREAIVYLGKEKYPLRLIETVDSEGNTNEIIANDAKITAEVISILYRNRWKIELFFKWMKQQTVLKVFSCIGPDC